MCVYVCIYNFNGVSTWIIVLGDIRRIYLYFYKLIPIFTTEKKNKPYIMYKDSIILWTSDHG